MGLRNVVMMPMSTKLRCSSGHSLGEGLGDERTGEPTGTLGDSGIGKAVWHRKEGGTSRGRCHYRAILRGQKFPARELKEARWLLRRKSPRAIRAGLLGSGLKYCPNSKKPSRGDSPAMCE